MAQDFCKVIKEIIEGENIFIKTIDLGHSVVHMRNDGIVQVNFGDNVELDVKETKDILGALETINNGKKSLVVNVAGKNTTATREARSYSASEEAAKHTAADAFVVNNLPQKLLGNFYLNFNKPYVKTKIFNKLEEALAWLKQQSV